MIRRYIILLFCLMATASLWAQEKVVRQDTIRYKVYFRQGYATIAPLYKDNQKTLDNFSSHVHQWMADSTITIQKIRITSGSSPDGVNKLNERLSLKRANAIVQYLDEHIPVDKNLIEISSAGVDWEELTRLVKQSNEVPDKNELLRILQDTDSSRKTSDAETRWKKRQILALNNGKTYQWLYDNLFPQLRHAGASIACIITQTVYPPVQETQKPVIEKQTNENQAPVQEEIQVEVAEPTPVQAATPKPPRWGALKTNALYLAALVPNIGLEYYIGKNWSISGNWMYAWWSNRGKNNFWRIYGGDVEARRWFGKKAEEKPLQGHHLGVYGQLLTYDFELGGRGYLGDKWSYAFGVSYGYSLPITRRLNLDFNLGIGYLGGKYKEYTPIDGHYVWQLTKNRQWFGPTKAEVSLVWLLGNENVNKKKGGRR